MRQTTIAIRTLVVLTVLCGAVYPALVTLAANALFPRQAAGSLVMRGGRIAGSDLIGQRFTSARYFHGRPSAAGDAGYDAAASGGSNLGPTSRKLVGRVSRDLESFRAANPSYGGPIPPDLLTASASGLDPHISPESAAAQMQRVAAARGLSTEAVRRLMERHIEDRQFGFLGEPRVNVLRLNLALDDAFAAR